MSDALAGLLLLLGCGFVVGGPLLAAAGHPGYALLCVLGFAAITQVPGLVREFGGKP